MKDSKFISRALGDLLLKKRKYLRVLDRDLFLEDDLESDLECLRSSLEYKLKGKRLNTNCNC